MRLFLLSLLAAATCSATCVVRATGATSLALKQSTVASPSTLALYYRVLDASTLELTLETDAAGWVSIGLSETGHMLGSDMAVINLNDSGVPQVLDMHAFWTASPLVDSSGAPVDPAPTPVLDAQQDWTLTCSVVSSGQYQYTITRSLVTTDTMQDRPVVDAFQHVVFAWADQEANTFAYHEANRGNTQLNFFSSPETFTPPSDVDGHVDIVMSDIPVSNSLVTQYICQGFDVGEGTQRHVVAFEPLVDGTGNQYLHHLLVHMCGNSSTTYPYSLHNSTNNASACQYPNLSEEGVSVLMQSGCTSAMYEWAIGGQPYSMPSVAGFLVGSDVRPPPRARARAHATDTARGRRRDISSSSST